MFRTRCCLLVSTAPNRAASGVIAGLGLALAIAVAAPAAAEMAPGPSSAAVERQCRAFLGRTFEGATVTKATLVAASANTDEFCAILAEM